MTLRELIDLASRHKDWYVKEVESFVNVDVDASTTTLVAIRCKNRCPIALVLGGSNSSAFRTAIAAGIPRVDVEKLMATTDGNTHSSHYCEDLRKEMESWVRRDAYE